MGAVNKLGRVSLTIASLTAAAAVGIGAQAASAGAGPAKAVHKSAATTTCKLGNGVQHVIEIMFDNVHFNRDNPNVPSDLEMMPHLLSFMENNGALLSNNHTPLIAHTATDSMTTYTGLYGDRAGMPISNDYYAYNHDGSADQASSFVYWTDHVADISSPVNAGHDVNPSMVYSPVPPATASTPVAPTKIAPAPWVPFTRAGCNVGEAASANMDLESTTDIPKVFGAKSPEAKQLAADKDSYKDPETADYIGIAVHCAAADAFCKSATAIKYGQTTPSPTAVADKLPNEPGGYSGYQALFGHRYVAPQLGAGKPNVKHNGYLVTNAKGNLVDLNGNELDGAYISPAHPGFPGYGINAAQSLAYVADMQESGVPVTYAYISDIHGNEYIPGLTACNGAPSALGSGSACYVAEAQYYDKAFVSFFARLAKDGITPQNSLFVFSADEGDHEAGANVGRALTPTPANCDGAKVSGTTVTPDVACTYATGSFGELDTNINGLLATEQADTTPFTLQAGVAPQFYLPGQPSPQATTVRSLERDVSALTATNPYFGGAEHLTNYLADPVEEGILHMVNVDSARTPTFSLFAKPDFWINPGPTNCTSACVAVNTKYAYDHGAYAAEINNNWVGFVGAGVAHLGLAGAAAGQGPNSSGFESGQETVPQQSADNAGPWVDETDIQPTMIYLAGLSDSYLPDGRVISQILATVPKGLAPAPVLALSTCYKQVASSVGEFGTWTLQAATGAIESNSSGDQTYAVTDQALSLLEHSRDYLTSQIEGQLYGAEFHGATIGAGALANETSFCKYLLAQAGQLAQTVSASTARTVVRSLEHRLATYRAESR